MKKRNLALLISALVIIPVGVILAATGLNRADRVSAATELNWEAVARPGTAVEGVEISKGKLIGTVEVSGIVEGISEAVMVSETTGTIGEVPAELGRYVREGDVLAVLDDTVERLNLSQVELQMENTARELDAAEKFFKSGTVSRADLTRAQGAYDGAKAVYERALKQLGDRSVRAPISGYLADVADVVARGNFLTAGTRVARIVDLSSLKMNASLGERQVGLVGRGASISVSVPNACPGEEFSGTLKAIAAGSDPATGSFRIVLEWANGCENIRSGMSAVARIETNENEESIIVPTAAFVTREGVRGVFTVTNGTAAFTPVSTSLVFGNRAVAISGLSEGDTVLVSGITALRDGDPVTVTLLGSSGAWR